MKRHSMCFLVLLLFPVYLFGGVTDLRNWINNGMNVKTPAGAQKGEKATDRKEFNAKPPDEKTRKLYSGRNFTGGDASLVFYTGVVLEGSNSFFFMQGAGKGLSSGFGEIRTTLVNQKVSPSLLQEFDRYSECALKRPFGTPWEQWTTEQKDSWNKVVCDWNELMAHVSKELQSNPEAYFFYWLGIDSFRLGAYVPHAIKEDGRSIESLMTEKITPSVNGFDFALSDPVAQRLTPEVLNAIKAIGGMKTKSDQRQITQTDIDTMQSEALAIINAGTNLLVR